MEYGLVIFVAVLFLYAVFSRRLSLTMLTGPILFVTLGLALGTHGLDIVDFDFGSGIITVLLEATLVLVLFTDAMGINLTRWREEASVPGRLLSIGLPLTMAAGTAVAVLIFSDLDFWEAALVGIILTPTDAALGQAVVSNPRVPERIRQGLNVESGLNDGIALPVFFVVLEAAIAAEESLSLATVIGEIAKELVIAVAMGVAVGWLACKLIIWARSRDWIAEGWGAIALLTVAFAAFLLADALGGSGFIGAWMAGLVCGRMLRGRYEGIHEFAEDTGNLLTVSSFFVFGGVILGPALGDLTWEVALYAVLSLTALRMLPVAVAMIGQGLKWPSVVYLGWFGPRGLASIILVLTVIDSSDLPGTATITLVMAATVGLSVYAHGATAWWGSNRYADWYESMGEDKDRLEESGGVPPVPVSRRIAPP